MKVRVIFRGLILFRFEQPKDEAGDVWELGDGPGCRLRALMINQQGSKGFHAHTPRMRIIGREAPSSEPLLGVQSEITGRVQIAFRSTDYAHVMKDPSMDDHVPSLSEVYGNGWSTKKGELDTNFVAAEVIVPAGRIRAKSLVSWTHAFKGKRKNSGVEKPVTVEFFWNPAWGPRYVANECVLEAMLLDDARVNVTGGRYEALRPLYQQEADALDGDGVRFGEMIDANTIDVLITNFAPQRDVAVPWSMHYQWLFQAAGYEGREGPEGFEDFREAAQRFDTRQWNHDYQHFVPDCGDPSKVKMFPIPHVVGIVPARAAAVHDPLNRPICPPGMEP